MKGKMMKTILTLTLLISVIALIGVPAFAASAEESANLVKNGNFEQGYSGWTADKSTSYTITSLDESNQQSDSYNPTYGQYSVEMETYNTAGFNNYYQVITLEKDKVYLLSADINVPTLTATDSYVGAFVGFKDGTATVTKLHITAVNSGFANYKEYISPKVSGDYTLVFGVGTSSLPVKADAFFDNISLVEVDASALPEGKTPSSIGVSAVADYTNTTTEGIVYTAVLGAFALLVVIFAYFGVRKLTGKEDEDIDNAVLKKDSKFKRFITNTNVYLIIAVVVGFAIRFALVNVIGGFVKDINNLSTWTSYLMSDGAASFYTKYPSAMQPSGYLYLMWFFGIVSSWLKVSVGTVGFAIMMRIPGILADLVMVYIIYELAGRFFNKLSALICACVYALLPIFFTLTATWGTFTMVAVLLMVLATMQFADKNIITCVIFLTLSVLLDSVMILPAVILTACYIVYFAQNCNLKQGLITFIPMVVALVAVYCISLPFTLEGIKADDGFDFFFPLVKMVDCFADSAKYFVYNSFNFYSLIGKNAVVVSDAMINVNWIFAIVLMAICVIMYALKRNRLEVMFYIAAAMLIYSVFGLYVKPAFFALGLAILIVYNLFAMDRRLFYSGWLFSVTGFLNLAHVMNVCGYIGSTPNALFIYLNGSDVMMIICSCVNILNALFLLYTFISIGFYGKFVPISDIEMSYKEYFKACCSKLKK